MKCKDFDKLIHLYFDGELDAGESKEIEEHLLTCQNCAAKLQELKKLEESAKGVRLPELSPDYWKTFAERVRNEIILRRRKSIWSRLKSGWESFFFYSPVKLRIAAGIASILLVFIIGKLYWDYKGKELERVRSERIEKALSIPVQQKPELQTPAVKESLQTKKPAKETTFVKPKPPIAEQKALQISTPSESISSVQAEKNAELQAPSESVISLAGEKAQGEKEKGAGESKTSELKKSITVTAERPKIEKGVTANLRTVNQAEMAMKPPSLPETILYVQKSPEDKRTAVTTTLRAPAAAKRDEGLYPAESVRYYKVDTEWVRALTDKDTLVEADTLKKVISSWKEYFEKKPVSEWTPEGFSQIKVAYELLFLKTSDEPLRQAGIKLLNQYKDSVTDQKMKDELTKNIFELEALKKK
ncbi:MAG: zf-HC2 domain-containing protein [candidate division Zixibacteria bacterium]|nr:zf-HC2 domain-containing protein [candidate division Zixibacteria bacterium]